MRACNFAPWGIVRLVTTPHTLEKQKRNRNTPTTLKFAQKSDKCDN
jgi:hypothetical protein